MKNTVIMGSWPTRHDILKAHGHIIEVNKNILHYAYKLFSAGLPDLHFKTKHEDQPKVVQK